MILIRYLLVQKENISDYCGKAQGLNVCGQWLINWSISWGFHLKGSWDWARQKSVVSFNFFLMFFCIFHNIQSSIFFVKHKLIRMKAFLSSALVVLLSKRYDPCCLYCCCVAMAVSVFVHRQIPANTVTMTHGINFILTPQVSCEDKYSVLMQNYLSNKAFIYLINELINIASSV